MHKLQILTKYSEIPSNHCPEIFSDEKDRKISTYTAELQHLHHKFRHCSFRKIIKLSKQGVIPSRIGKANTPLLSACMNSKADLRPWKNKRSKHYEVKKTQPGYYILVNKTKSTTMGIIAQLTGILTTKRYNIVNIFF